MQYNNDTNKIKLKNTTIIVWINKNGSGPGMGRIPAETGYG
jgi:hypothetical protein